MLRRDFLMATSVVAASAMASGGSGSGAASMNRMRKYVFSRTLQKVEWENSSLLTGDLAREVRNLKTQRGPALLIMGSGEIVSQLTGAGLIDEYQLVTVPLIVGRGRSLFEGVTTRPRLKLTQTRTFQNGNVVNWYSV
jgi:dihydrofolate reductase